ncbi:MAG: ATP-binding domain-containing protein, partial [Acidobacteria bacterium]|nr:ATP-binding domain-containing protein [Acidobacteriota bacterium]
YEGTVYSLKVERDETYAANGIVTHNCIYTWRGAMPQYIRKFRDYYPTAKVVKLEQNYRSTARIVASAVAVIERNTDAREPKRMFTSSPDGDRVSVVLCEDERQEAELIAKVTKARVAAGEKPSQTVVLYRSHAMSRAIEEGLRTEDIKYKIHGGFRFFDRAEIRDAMAYLRLIVNPSSNVDLLRVINSPARGIGPKTVGRIADLAASKNVSLFDCLEDAKTWGALGLKERQGIVAFQSLINEGRSVAGEAPPSEVVAGLMERSGMIRHWLNEAKRLGDDGKQEKAAAALARTQNLQEMITDATRFETAARQRGEPPTLDAYVERITMLADDTEDGDASSVHLMTIHAAKGLEFDNVFIVGCEQGLFPSERARPGSADDQEERRLMYVGVTRAKKRLVLTRAESRFLYGKVLANKPSPYLSDMPPTSAIEVMAETILDSHAKGNQ